MKVAIGEFRHETDSFNPQIWDLPCFQRFGMYNGEEIPKALGGKPCAVGGMIDLAKEHNAEITYLHSMNGNSGGLVSQETVDYFIEKCSERLKPVLPVDILLVSMHGATQTTENDDGCGYILEKLRAIVGEKTIISISCDLHANATEKMTEMANYICGYHTYPHVDNYETGSRAARIAFKAFLEKEKPVMVRTEIPMIVPASSYTTGDCKFGHLMDYAKSLVADNKILDFNIFMMQPWLDVSVGASSVLVIANDKETATHYTMDIATKLFDIKDSFNQKLLSIDEVIDIAEKNTSGKPVILVDAADSSNAGACGDSPAILEHVLNKNSKLRMAMHLNDKQAIDKIYKAGKDTILKLSLGGTYGCEYYNSIEVEAKVKDLYPGRFILEGPANKGMEANIGRVAVLEIENCTVVVCEATAHPGDPQIFRSFGIEPTDYQLVSVKACTSFRASYEQFAEQICETDTPGAAPVVLNRLNFKKLPRFFFPFADISDYKIPTPV